MIHIKAFESRHHLARLKATLRRELKVWSSGLCLEGNRISAGGNGSFSDNSSRDSAANETSAESRTDNPKLNSKSDLKPVPSLNTMEKSKLGSE